MPRHRSRRPWFPAALLLGLSACFTPSYPREQVASTVQDLCRKEYRLEVSARFVGGTLYARHVMDNLVESDLKLQSEKLGAIDKMLRVTNRVAQSTDADVQFLVLQLEDRRLSTRLDILERFEDYVALRNTRISQEEFQERLVIEWVKGSPEEENRALSLADFISRLVVSRLERNISGNLFVGVLFDARSIVGRIEKGTLSLTLGRSHAPAAGALADGVLSAAVREVTRHVLKIYDPRAALVQRVALQDGAGKVLWSLAVPDLAASPARP